MTGPIKDEAVTVSLNQLRDGKLTCTPFGLGPDPKLDTVPFEVLEDALGPSSLGILIVSDLPSQFTELRHRLLSYASYLANLPGEQLGKFSLAARGHYSRLCYFPF